MLDTKQILQENLKALLATRPEISRLNLSREMAVADGTLGSIQYGKGNPTLEILESIARFFNLETWQLLCPNLGESLATSSTKARRGSSAQWPFAEIKLLDFCALSRADKDEIEHQIVYKINRAKRKNIAKRKPDSHEKLDDKKPGKGRAKRSERG